MRRGHSVGGHAALEREAGDQRGEGGRRRVPDQLTPIFFWFSWEAFRDIGWSELILLEIGTFVCETMHHTGFLQQHSLSVEHTSPVERQ